MKKASEVKPYGVVEGTKIVDYKDVVALQEAEMLENAADPGIRKMNPDGTIARSKCSYAAIKLSDHLANRYRYVRSGQKKKVQIVTDWRAIDEQKTGQVYLAKIPCTEIEKDGDKFKVTRRLTISDDEFIKDFVHTLPESRMLELLPLIEEGAGEITEEDLDI